MTRKIFFSFLIVFLITVPVAAQTEGNTDVTLSSLQIDLWPEYDQPSMLVIYRMTLASEVQLPAQITIRIPAAAGEPNAVATRDESGAYDVSYTRDVQGEWAYITVSAALPGLQIEFYDPQLEFDGVNRHYTYQWPGDYDVDTARILVQNPIGATDVTTLPRLSSNSQDGEGITYQAEEVGSLRAGEPFELTIDYVKEADGLTADFLTVQSTAPVTPDTPGRVDVTDLLPLGLGLIGVFLLIGGVFFWNAGRNGKKHAKSQARKKSRKRRVKQIAPQKAQTGDLGIFCHECGKRAGGGDRFCRACGTPLRNS